MPEPNTAPRTASDRPAAPAPVTLTATAAFGLEAVVARELEGLGYAGTSAEPGRVRFEADRLAICRTNLALRSADRVLLELGRFEARDFGVLFDGVTALPWEDWLPRDACFPVRGKTVRSQLSSLPACQRIVKKAVVERLRRAHGCTDLPETGASFAIEIALVKNMATLSIDTSGAGLHKRGYRTGTGPAPLKETLAAALVQLSFWRWDRPLLDPLCGSGTIPIEAALIGRNQAPGLNRSFVAESWPAVPVELWAQARKEAHDAVLEDRQLDLAGSDHDPDALALARFHARNAGFGSLIHWQLRDVRDLPPPERDWGCLITNPPYGERLGEQEDARDLYRDLPDVLGRFPTWSHYILAPHEGFERIVGRKADRRRKLYNGRIRCTYFQFHGPPPPRDDAEPQGTDITPRRPAFGGLPEKTEQQADQFRRRLAKRARHLRRWPTRQGITCFRIYDCDVPGVALVIDRYEDCLHISDYERGEHHQAGQHEPWLNHMVAIAADKLGVPLKNVFVKTRSRQAGKKQHRRVAGDKNTRVVNEGGLKFQVNLSDYIDTGLFLDHRQTRAMVRDLAAGKRVLNLFCYTGAFTVYAAAGGASETCSVDLSSTYLEWAERNLQLNDLDGPQHRFIRTDVIGALREAPPERPFDLVVVDPPTFSNSKATDTVFDVQRDHRELLRLVLQCVAPGGTCIFSTNRRKFRFEAGDLPGIDRVTEITNRTLPEDFRQRGAHRCWRITRAGAASVTSVK